MNSPRHFGDCLIDAARCSVKLFCDGAYWYSEILLEQGPIYRSDSGDNGLLLAECISVQGGSVNSVFGTDGRFNASACHRHKCTKKIEYWKVFNYKFIPKRLRNRKREGL